MLLCLLLLSSTVSTNHICYYYHYCCFRWFTTLVNQPQFQAVVGKVDLAKEELLAAGAPAPAKKEKKVRGSFRAYTHTTIVSIFHRYL
jgi:hypothetical protein